MPVDDAKIDHGQIEHLAILAHELRSPLAAIDLAVDLLEAQAPDLGAVGHARTLIKRQLEQILRLTDDLLDLLDVARINKLH